MKIYVNNCHDCPLCNNDNEFGYSCNFPESEVVDGEMTGYDSTIPPEKCPLKHFNVIIELKEQEKIHKIEIDDSEIL